MQLSKRLQLVASFVSEGQKMAEIGTDHGYVPVYLVQEKKVPYAYACDVNKGPLERAGFHIKEAGLQGQIETRLGSGLSVLRPGEAQSVVIAGMGGPLMVRLLEERADVVAQVTELILSPHSEIDTVRRYLHAHGFAIVREEMVLDEGKFYTVMKAVPGQETNYTETEYRYGRHILQTAEPVFGAYLSDCIRKLTNLQAQLQGTGYPAAKEKLAQVETELEQVRVLYTKLYEREKR